MSWWQRSILVPGILTFLGICAENKKSLTTDVVKVIKQIRDVCIEVVGRD